VAELYSTMRPFIIRRQGRCRKVAPKEDLQRVASSNTFFATAALSVVVDEELCKTKCRHERKGYWSENNISNPIMELKKCCNHRLPFKNVEDVTFKITVETLIRAAGEIILLDKLLLRLRDKGHRVLVFSQMVTMLDILSDYCRMRGFPFQSLDRSMPNDLRVRAVDHYNAPESTDYVSLISTRARGPGINLYTADTVSYLTRTGIHRAVFRLNLSCASHRTNKGRLVFRLLSRETVEEDILELAKQKCVLEHLVLHGLEGDEQDKKGKNTFSQPQFKAILPPLILNHHPLLSPLAPTGEMSTCISCHPPPAQIALRATAAFVRRGKIFRSASFQPSNLNGLRRTSHFLPQMPFLSPTRGAMNPMIAGTSSGSSARCCPHRRSIRPRRTYILVATG
jgi:Helicase conserved C-terminal domain